VGVMCETSSFLMSVASHVQGASLFVFWSSPRGTVDVVSMTHVPRAM